MQGVVLHTCNPSAGDIEAGLQANGIFKDSLGCSMRLFIFPASDLANLSYKIVPFKALSSTLSPVACCDFILVGTFELVDNFLLLEHQPCCTTTLLSPGGAWWTLA